MEEGGGVGDDELYASSAASAYARVRSAPSRQARGEGNVVETPDSRALFSMERVGRGGGGMRGPCLRRPEGAVVEERG